MNIPNLQIALDNNNLEDALLCLQEIAEYVDIIEAGTILCLNEGMKAVKYIKTLYPDKILLADTKCADAGKTVANNCKLAGADWMTVICSATLPTMKAAFDIMSDLQVELYGDWTFEHAKSWYDLGIRQVVYHQSRDSLLSGGSWGEKDLNKIEKLIDMGFKVSVTGGLDYDKIDLFRNLDVYTFIVGRGLREADNPAEEAAKWKKRLEEIWG
ncbi:MAG: 3-keto-L-gulonate-6-phosphate decarboxylase UlaD [Tissierellia bacterium]|nr:3-keto-L-gulonate-6-phosphate decarboxylase UlaD [Tissierellia bacterium]